MWQAKKQKELREQLRLDEYLYGQSFCLLIRPGKFKVFIYSLFGKIPKDRFKRIDPMKVRRGQHNYGYYDRSRSTVS